MVQFNFYSTFYDKYNERQASLNHSQGEFFVPRSIYETRDWEYDWMMDDEWEQNWMKDDMWRDYTGASLMTVSAMALTTVAGMLTI